MLPPEIHAPQLIPPIPKTNRSLKAIVSTQPFHLRSTPQTFAKKQLQYVNNREHMSYFDKLKMMIGANEKYGENVNILEKRVSTITEDSRSRSRSKRPASRVSLAKERGVGVGRRERNRLTGQPPNSQNILNPPPLPPLDKSREILDRLTSTVPAKNLNLPPHPPTAKPHKVQLVNYSKNFEQLCQNGYRFTTLELSEVLGTGANASVRLGFDKSTSTKYAVKVYEKYKLIEPRKMKSVRREIKLLRQLDHENIICLMNAYEDRKQIHMIMQYFQGQTLQTFFRSQLYSLPQPLIKHLSSQLLHAVKHIHQNNLAHRDIKLDNILIDPNSATIKLIDFGFATATLVKSEIQCGTPNYMAPELHTKNCCYDPSKVDVWAIGVSLYYLQEGVFPFKGYDDKDLVRKVRVGEYAMRKGTGEFVGFIRACLCLDPEKRPSCKSLLSHPWLIT